MKIKKFAATVLTVVLALGSSFNAFADDGTEYTGDGEGTSTNHLDTNYAKMVLPTDNTVIKTLDFYVDPEDILQNADKLPNGDDATSVHNDDLVYFKTGTGTYASTSKEIEIEVKNFDTAYFTVTASVNAVEEGETALPLVDSPSALVEGTPGLYLKLNVGTESGSIASNKNTAVECEVAGQEDNFEVKLASAVDETPVSYNIAEKTGATWDTVKVSMQGKAAKATVDSTIMAPKISFTWNIISASEKEVTYAMTKDATGNLVYTFTENAPTGTITAFTVGGVDKMAAVSAGNVTYSASKFTIKKAAVTNLGLTEGNTTAIATIGGTEYKFTY
jgi:hypothetical protein